MSARSLFRDTARSLLPLLHIAMGSVLVGAPSPARALEFGDECTGDQAAALQDAARLVSYVYEEGLVHEIVNYVGPNGECHPIVEAVFDQDGLWDAETSERILDELSIVVSDFDSDYVHGCVCNTGSLGFTETTNGCATRSDFCVGSDPSLFLSSLLVHERSHGLLCIEHVEGHNTGPHYSYSIDAPTALNYEAALDAARNAMEREPPSWNPAEWNGDPLFSCEKAYCPFGNADAWGAFPLLVLAHDLREGYSAVMGRLPDYLELEVEYAEIYANGSPHADLAKMQLILQSAMEDFVDFDTYKASRSILGPYTESDVQYLGIGVLAASYSDWFRSGEVTVREHLALVQRYGPEPTTAAAQFATYSTAMEAYFEDRAAALFVTL